MRVLHSGRVKAFAFLAIGIVGGSLAVGPLPPAFAKAFQGQLHVKPNIVFTGNSGQATLKAINNGSGYAIVGQSNTSAALFGQSVSGGGIVGLSTSGYGLTGTSATNIGLNGTSTSNDGVGGSTHTDFPFAGVVGMSLSGTVNSVGVYGQGGATGYGTLGTCSTTNTGTCTGVLGDTLGTNGVAVYAFGLNAAPSAGYTPSPALQVEALGGGPAVQVLVGATSGPIYAIDGNGTESMSAANNAPVLVTDASGLSGDSIDANTVAGNAGVAELGQASGTAVNALGYAAAGGAPALNVTDVEGANDIIVHDSFTCGCDVMSLDSGGNMILLGNLTIFGTPLIRTKTGTGHAVSTYSTQQTEPTVEDFGQGQLVDGEGAVRLDPAFANTMDLRKSYLVFITPDGDSRGLYTTQKTPSGFVVRENGGGRSTLAFDYRIVGKPFDNSSPRLPFAPSAITSTRGEQMDALRARYLKTHFNMPHGTRALPPFAHHR
jgi:hypothetical protein